MTQFEWQKLEATVAEMTTEEKEQLLALVNASLRAAASPDAKRPAENACHGERTLYDVFADSGALGCFDGPPDLSTNPDHMKGFARSEQ